MQDAQDRSHGGGIDAAISLFGGERIGWIDLSTGINPRAYPVAQLPFDCWRALPDKGAETALLSAARRFWQVPRDAHLLAAPGASNLIAQMPTLRSCGRVLIPAPTYNEHRTAFSANGWDIATEGAAEARVFVHPNNPDGRLWDSGALPGEGADLTVIDESFCDVAPQHSMVSHATRPGWVVLKSFGKFWGLAGLRLGFAIGGEEEITLLRNRLGPWAVSGPALAIATAALEDDAWATATRRHLAQGSARLDGLMTRRGARVVGGTTLFRLYHVDKATAWQEHLARHHIWSRVFPYNQNWLRLGLPDEIQWPRVEAALT